MGAERHLGLSAAEKNAELRDDVKRQDKWQQSKRGKGRVAASGIQAATTAVPKLRAVSHSDAEHGECENDPAPRYDPRLVDGWAAYLSLDSPQNTYKATAMMYDKKPVLMRDAPVLSKTLAAWTFDSLAAAAPRPTAARPSSADEVEVLCSDRHQHRFIECDASKNLAVSPYHVREPETQRFTMTVREFVECARRWDARRVLLKATVLKVVQLACAPVKGPMAGPAAALHAGISWEWITALRQSQGFGPVLRVDLEAGTAGGLQPARYSPHEELLVQVCGRRRVLLIPPDQAFQGMFPFPIAHPYDRYSMVDLESLDPSTWPGCTGVRGVVAVLRPGDVLHVPAYWFAHHQDLTAESMALRFVMHPGVRAPAPEASPLRLSRVLEERVGDVVGTTALRAWLLWIGKGTEVSKLDLGSLHGYRRAVMCQGVRDEVEGTLGAGAWAQLLPAMCAGRLVPTPWLNKNFREPLLLADKPTVLEDDRTDEEKRYPTLFRKKLESQGWQVPVSKSTIPLPSSVQIRGGAGSG